MHIDELLARRRALPPYDAALWTFMERIAGRNLRNLADEGLQARLGAIDRNILHLDDGSTPRDGLPPERGWLSPWWWLRARHWTLLEFQHRDLAPQPTPSVPPMPAIRGEFRGVVAGGGKLLVRITRRDWALDMLRAGRLRFAPAQSYSDASLGAARADDEMAKSYRRPGQVVSITGQGGEAIPALSDVTFTTRRSRERDGALEDMPYWLLSFSSDLDPRLFSEFYGEDVASAACVVVFDPMAMVRRALPHLCRAAPTSMKDLFPVEYRDPHHPEGRPSPLRCKDMVFALQREMRFVLDPGGRFVLGGGEALFVDAGSLADIAAVYSPSGERIAGSGPNTYLA